MAQGQVIVAILGPPVWNLLEHFDDAFVLECRAPA
jgi:hypothetical protein